MRNFNVEAKLLTNGAKITVKVQANSKDEAELIAGRRFLEMGFKGDQVKIVAVD